jgi:hypothetical protein
MERDEALAAPLAGPAGESGEAGEAISALMMRRWPKKSALAKKRKAGAMAGLQIAAQQLKLKLAETQTHFEVSRARSTPNPGGLGG